MRRSNPVALGLIAAAVYAMCCAMAFGQQAGTASTQSGATAGVPDKSRVPPGGEQAKEPRNNNDAINAGIMMQRSGGSLLRATLSSQPDPQQAKLSHVSFFAVPEPQPKTMKAHDLITIIIREQSEFQSNGTTDLKRLATIDARLEEWIKLNTKSIGIQGGGVGTSGPVPSVKASGQTEWKGEGQVDRTDSFTARITAEVLDVKPNGTLVLQGKKTIRMDEEEQQFIITGTARAEDVTADNTVLSTQLKDLSLTKANKGDLRSAQRRGLIPKLLDLINPF